MSKTPPSRGKCGSQACSREEAAPKSHVWGSSVSLHTHALGLPSPPSLCSQNPPHGDIHDGEHGSAGPRLLLHRANCGQVLNPAWPDFGQCIPFLGSATFLWGMHHFFKDVHNF